MRLLIFILSIVALSSLKAEDFWQPLIAPDSSIINSIVCGPNGYIYTGTDSGIYYSLNQGNSWIYGNMGNSCVVDYVSANNKIFGVATNDTLSYDNIYSTNYGETWHRLFSPKSTIHFAEESLLIASKIANYHVFRSINAGNTWQEVFHMPSGGSEFVRSVISQNDSTFFMGITDFLSLPGNTCGGVYRSNDSGATWQRFGLKYHFVWAMAKDSTGNIYAGVNGHYYEGNGGVFVNNGQDSIWQQLKSNILVTSLAVTPDNVLYAGHREPAKSYGGVIRSFDGGQNWEDITSGMGENRSVERMIASPDGYLYALAEYNGQRQLYRSHKSTRIESTTSTKQLELSGYPNPFNNECRITFQLPSGSEDRSFITIYNIKGEVVQRAKVSGNHYTFRAASLAVGVYYAVVNTGNLSKGVRLLYLK